MRYTVRTSWLSNTNYLDAGGWTPAEFCPNGSYATAYAMEVCSIHNHESSPHDVNFIDLTVINNHVNLVTFQEITSSPSIKCILYPGRGSVKDHHYRKVVRTCCLQLVGGVSVF